MREAFVLTLGDGNEPARLHFTGWIEHVDTGRERRFRSTDELLVFIADCLERNGVECSADDREEQP